MQIKKHFFTIFISLLGLFTAYVFYTFWHLEEINPSNNETEEKIIKYESLENKKVISKASSPLPKTIQAITPKVLANPKNFQTQISIEEKNEEVYESLNPDTQQEFTEEAIEVFETLDTEIMEMEEGLLEEESGRMHSE